MDKITANVLIMCLQLTVALSAVFFVVVAAVAMFGLITWTFAGCISICCVVLVLALSLALFLPQTSKYKAVRRQMIIEGYTIEQEYPANWIMQGESAGGYLFLCADKMVFVAHDINAHTGFIVLPYTEIQSILLERIRYIDLFLTNGEIRHVAPRNRKQVKYYLERKLRRRNKISK